MRATGNRSTFVLDNEGSRKNKTNNFSGIIDKDDEHSYVQILTSNQTIEA